MTKPSRRDLLQTTIMAAAAPLVLTAQTTAPQLAASNPFDDARKNLAESAKAVAAVPLPQSTEPAFIFKV